MVNLTAGRRYALEAFQLLKGVDDASKINKNHQMSQPSPTFSTAGWYWWSPWQSAGRHDGLVEINEAGVRQTLAEAAGGFGAADVDEEAAGSELG